MKKIFSLMAIAAVGVTFTACHNSLDDERAAIQENEIAAKKTAFQEAFTKTFGEISGNQDWGFGEDLKYPTIDMSTSSPLFTDENSAARALTRGSQVPVSQVPVKYTNWDQLQKMTEATAYYFIRIDNRIVEEEKNKANGNQGAWTGMPANQYWPKTPQYNATSNEGTVDMAKIYELTGKNFIFNDLGVNNEVLRQVPSFETVISWIGQGGTAGVDYAKIREDCKNFKDVIWYVAKWQQGNDNVIHVDGILTDVSRTIICEDLGSIGDFDYNDAVFDVTIYSDQDGNHAKITLKAAGGTLKLTVGDREIHEALLKDGKTYENGSYPMINTGAGVEADPVVFTYNFPPSVTNNFINNIPVVVTYKDGSTKTLDATKGQAPEKIAVLNGFVWPSEKQNIKSKYSHFKDYVEDTTGEWNAPKWYEN